MDYGNCPTLVYRAAAYNQPTSPKSTQSAVVASQKPFETVVDVLPELLVRGPGYGVKPRLQAGAPSSAEVQIHEIQGAIL